MSLAVLIVVFLLGFGFAAKVLGFRGHSRSTAGFGEVAAAIGRPNDVWV